MKRLLYKASRLFSLVFLSLFIFLFAFSILAFIELRYNWDIPFVEIGDELTNEAIAIRVPIIEMYLKFPNSFIVIIPLLVFGFYTFYFFQLSKFLKVFIPENLFSQDSVRQLQRFLNYNLFATAIAFISSIAMWLREGFTMQENFLFLIIHLFISILVYLYPDMGRKGLQIQQENDLTI